MSIGDRRSASHAGVTQIIFINGYRVAPLMVVVGEGITSDDSEPSIVSRLTSKRTQCYFHTRLAHVALASIAQKIRRDAHFTAFERCIYSSFSVIPPYHATFSRISQNNNMNITVL